MNFVRHFPILALVLASGFVLADRGPMPVAAGTGKATLTFLIVDTQAHKIVRRVSLNYSTMKQCHQAQARMHKEISERNYPVDVSCTPS